jgi:hypothetical protein
VASCRRAQTDSRLHAEDAVAEVVKWGVGACGQCEREDAEGVAGVDDAVVPEAGGGVERVALLLVLVA